MKFWQKTLRIADSLVNLIIALFFLPILLYGIYAIWDSEQVYKNADQTVYQTYRPVSDTTASFEQLKEINPEVFGWLVIEGTNIDYPLVQAQNNSKYVNTNVEGKFSLAGSIFLDCRNDNSFTNVNHVVYGHNLSKDAMFGELEEFGNESFFDQHPCGKIFYDDQWHKIEFFAFAHADAYDSVIFNADLKGETGNQTYLDYVKEKASIFKDLSFTSDEHYISLSTCTSNTTNGRHILIGRIVDMEE